MNDQGKEREGITVTPEPATATVSTTLGAVLVKRLKEVGIPPDEFPKLESYVEGWKDRGLTDGEAWSLVISVEQWRQARMAFWVAVAIGLFSILVAIGIGLLSIVSQLITYNGG